MTLLLKLVLTPALVGGASLAGRRWGPAVSGWLVGLPLTSAPVAFFLALDHGEGFAATVAAGTLAGTISQAAFALAYCWLAARGASWPAALAGGTIAFAVFTLALRHLGLGPLPLAALVVVALVLALLLLPRAARAPVAAGALPGWDLPARMIAATLLVLALTALAPHLGPRLTGMLTPYPLYAAILTVFAHALEGPPAAIGVMRGLLVGLFGFVAFFLVLALLIERAGIAGGFAAATAVALAVQGASLLLLRGGPAPRPLTPNSPRV